MDLLPETTFDVSLISPFHDNIGLVLGNYPYLLEYNNDNKDTQYIKDLQKITYFTQEVQNYPVIFNFIEITTPNQSALTTSVTYESKSVLGTERKTLFVLKNYENPRNVNSLGSITINLEKPLCLSVNNFLFFDDLNLATGSTTITIGMKGLKAKIPAIPTLKSFIEKNLRI